jgi:hypothetical protein
MTDVIAGQGALVTDPLGFPVLASSAITQTFAFLYGRLAALLDRRNAAAGDDVIPDHQIPPELAGRLAPLNADGQVLARLWTELDPLAEVLSVYREHPELINGEDERLRRNLGKLRAALEAIYHQHFTFEGEARPPSGVKVEQRMDKMSGELIGLAADEVTSGAHADITQVSRTVSKDGKVVGAKIKRID